MSTQTTPGISRRTWRTALIVFLVVLLGGSGVSGAYALWSKQSNVTATVKTGTWVDYTRRDWTWEPQVSAERIRVGGTQDVRFTWTDPADTTGEVKYHVTLDGPFLGWVIGDESKTVTANFVEYRTTRPLISQSYDLTITAYVNGVPSTPVKRTYTVYGNGSITLR
jgi:hypothetical protein